MIYLATASNPNFGSFTTWSIDPASADAGKFNIDPSLGVLRFNITPLYTDQHNFSITIVATDGITPSSYDILTLTIVLVKQPPIFV